MGEGRFGGVEVGGLGRLVGFMEHRQLRQGPRLSSVSELEEGGVEAER